MPNVIKYSVTTENQALRSGNFYLGVGDVGKGPTESSGYWNGISPPVSGYTVYLNKATQGPSIYTPNNDSDLITITNMIGGTSFTSVTQCFNWYATQSDKMVVNKDYPTIVTSGLVLNLDASFRPSYTGSGTTWYDVSVSDNTSTLTNGPTYNNGGWIVFDGIDDYLLLPTITLNTNAGFTIDLWIYIVDPQPVYSNFWSYWYSTGNGGFEWGTYANVNGQGKFSYKDSSAPGTPSISSPYVGNKWANIVFGCSGTTPFMYTNGISSGTSGNFSNKDVRITNLLRNNGQSTYYKCNHSYIRFYNRALTFGEILQNYYQGNIVTNGLIQYLDASNLVSFPLTGTAFTDMSGYGNSATLVNGASYKINTVPCISLDGTDDKITITNKDLSGLTYNIQYDINWTLACWIYVKTYDASPQTYKHIYGNYNGCNYTALKGNAGGIIIYNSTSQGLINLNLGFGPRNNPSGSQCPAIEISWSNAQVGPQLWGLQNRWAYFAITSDDGTNYKLYIDGVQAGPTKTVDFKNSQSRIDNQLTSTSQYAWGNAGGNNNAAIEADFAICQIYNRALSASEIQQNFNAQRNRFRV